MVSSIATAQDSPVKQVYTSKPIAKPYLSNENDDDAVGSTQLNFENEDMLDEIAPTIIKSAARQQTPDNDDSLHVEEYASVFRSRPKIAVSPNTTPSRGSELDF